MAADHCIKRCTRCKSEKPISDFNKDKHASDGLQSKCRACQKEVRHEWYLQNREREIAKSLEWAKSNPEKAREKDRRRAVKNPGRTSAQARAWRLAHPDQARAFGRAWKKRNPEKVLTGERRRYMANPEKYLAKSHRRRVRAKINGGAFTRAQIERLYKLQKCSCAACKKKLHRKFHRDHIVPLVHGGSNDITNIQLLCPPCNAKKHAKDPVHFMQEQGFLI